jgi:hypothetical protein
MTLPGAHRESLQALPDEFLPQKTMMPAKEHLLPTKAHPLSQLRFQNSSAGLEAALAVALDAVALPATPHAAQT